MSDEELVVKIIAGLTIEVETKQEVIYNLTAMNDELQAKVDKIEQIVNNYDGSMYSMVKQFSEIQEVLEKE